MGKARDFLYLKRVQMEEKKVIVSSKSVELDEFPVYEHKERGEIIISGYIIE